MSTHANLLFGKYKLLELVARGGMAEVFKAKSYGVDGFEKLVVIKRILPDLAQNQTFVEMCINEAKLSVALSHANIVQVFDLGREEDTYFIVMEYVHGMDYAEVLRRVRRSGNRTPMELCVYIASETARALDYAHRRRDAQMRPLNVVHRDISPQNVLLSFEGEVKVTDFGIAKARTSIEESGTVKGKYAYMAPEQARGIDVDARADIYALGVVLYESLAGKNPFQEPTPYQTLRRVQAGEKPPIKLAWPEVPDELARIVETATAPNRDQRYPSAAKFYEDLAGFLYTTGKRVAAHDLAEWMSDLRGAVGQDDDSLRMRDALEEIEPSAVKTPVEVPSSTGHASRPGPSTSSGHSRPHLERRDVTLVSIETSAPANAPRPSLASLISIASRYGGVVADQTEYHAVAIFGAQEPDGRDTETALRCSLKMQHAAERALPGTEVGFGVHAARIHVNGENEPERDQWFTGALALVRDLGRAAGSRILASEPVGRLVAEQFNLEPLKARTAALERIAGTPLHVTGERGMHEGAHRRFVGRREPFRRVGEIVAWSNKRGSRAVTLLGEAGTGKSRFLDEVHYRLRRMNHPVNWYTATCLPHQREIAFSGVQSMLRTILGIDDVDPEAAIREKSLRVRELGLSADELRGVQVVLGVGGRDEANAPTPTSIRGAVIRVATRLSQDQLTVLVWDGAENMDDDSQTLVDELVRTAGRARVVVLLACRPGFIYAWKDAPTVEEITLGPLTEDEMRMLVAQRLGVAREAALPKELLDDLWSKGSGNPLFIEEYLRSLSESGGIEIRDGEVLYRREVAELGVPKTLRGLVASEIARLSVAQRAVLQVASVIGARFHQELVADVGNFAVPALVQAPHALVERGSIVLAGNDEFGFAHELRREVVYEGLPLDARRELHATVAAAIERLYPARLDELAERLAHHYRESNDRVRAVEFLVRAARRQESEAAFAGATNNLARALELVLASPRADAQQVMDLYANLGRTAIRGRQVQVGTDKLRLGLAYAEDLGDSRWIVRMLLLLGRLLALQNRIVEAVAHFERAKTLADPGDRATLGELATAIGSTFVRNGEFKRAYQHLEEAARLADARGDRRDAAHSLLALCRCEAASGERQRALSTWERANDIASNFGDPVMQAELEKCLALVHFHTRDFQQTVVHSERALEIAREFGLHYESAANAHNIGDACIRLGDYKRAFASLMFSLTVAQEHGFEKLTHLNNVYLAFIDAARFGSDEGRAKVEAALAYAEAHGYTWDMLHSKYLLGVLAKEQGDRDKASRLLREALLLANDTDNRMYAEDCETLLREIASIPPAGAASSAPR